MLTYETIGGAELDNATSVALTFTTQKNSMKGKVTRNGMTGDPCTCPVRAVVQRLQYHKEYQRQPDMPLCCYCSNHKAKFVRTNDVALTQCAGIVMVKLKHNVTLNLEPRKIDSHSLHSGGANAPLSTKVDCNLI